MEIDFVSRGASTKTALEEISSIFFVDIHVKIHPLRPGALPASVPASDKRCEKKYQNVQPYKKDGHHSEYL